MDKKSYLELFKYYKGESHCPYYEDKGKAFWWKVERYAYERKDEKENNQLSMTMVEYLKEHHWQGDAHSDTTVEEFLHRAKELYLKGIWSRSYICLKAFNFKDAERENFI